MAHDDPDFKPFSIHAKGYQDDFIDEPKRERPWWVFWLALGVALMVSAIALADEKLVKDEAFSMNALACDEAEQVSEILTLFQQGKTKEAKSLHETYQRTPNFFGQPTCSAAEVLAYPLEIVGEHKDVHVNGTVQDYFIVKVKHAQTGYVFYIASTIDFKGMTVKRLSM